MGCWPSPIATMGTRYGGFSTRYMYSDPDCEPLREPASSLRKIQIAEAANPCPRRSSPLVFRSTLDSKTERKLNASSETQGDVVR